MHSSILFATRPCPFTLCAALALLVCSFSPVHAQKGGAVDFDVRDRIRIEQRLVRASATSQTPDPAAARIETAKEYLHSQPLLASAEVTWNRHGWPKVLRPAPGEVLSAQLGGSAEAQARAFVDRHGLLFGLRGGNGGERLRKTAEFSLGGGTVVHFVQTVGDLEIAGAAVSVVVNKSGEVIRAAAGDLVATGSLPNPVLSEQQAVEAALRGPAEADLARENGRTRYSANAASGASTALARPVAFPLTPTAVVPGFEIFLRSGGRAEFLIVSALDGSTLLKQNLRRNLTSGTVYNQNPAEGPAQQRDFPLEWLPDGSTATTGPLADVYVDADGDDLPDTMSTDTIRDGRAYAPDGTFDFMFPSSGDNPRDFPAAAITNAFAAAASAHDYLYSLGFDEAAGNFQSDNGTGGGQGGDPVVIEVHDPERINNASVLITPDGESPVIELGIFLNGTLFDLDDDHDTAYSGTIIFHEYAQAMTERLVRAPGRPSCLVGTHGLAMGEGWADYFAGSYFDDPVVGGYISGDTVRGIRRHAMDSSPLTYADLGNEGFEEHNDGEIWASVLWAIRTALGQEVADRLIVDGLKMTPCDPSMVEARDAILDADRAANGASNVTTLWGVFAEHGLGFSATGYDGFRVDPTMFTAAFDTPPGRNDNRLPLVVSRVADFVLRGDPWGYRITASDSDQDTLTYELLEAPEGLTINAETGRMSWMADQFTAPLIKTRVSDGTGEVIHGVTVPIITLLEQNIRQAISAPTFSQGFVAFFVSPNTEITQMTLRGGTGDPDVTLFGPGAEVTSERIGPDETLTVSHPLPGFWIAFIDGTRSYENVQLRFLRPSASSIPPNTSRSPLVRAESSESYFSVEVPAGSQALVVSAGGGEGDADLYLAFDRFPVCQDSALVDMLCDFDGSSTDIGNFDTVTINGASLQGEKATRVEAPSAGRWFINLSAHRAFSDLTLRVLVDGGGGIPSIAEGGVVNGASFAEGLAPGSIATLFGTALASGSEPATTIPLPTDLQTVSLTMNGIAAPLYFASPTQLNFQVPFDIAPGTATVSIERAGRSGTLAPARIFADAPAIFTYTAASGLLEPVIVHADGSLVTPESPAKPNEVLVIFFTGLGGVSNPPGTGQAAGASPLSTALIDPVVEVDGAQADVLFAGLTAGLVGLAQLNIQLPAVLPAGGRASVTIRIANATSPPTELAVMP